MNNRRTFGIAVTALADAAALWFTFQGWLGTRAGHDVGARPVPVAYLLIVIGIGAFVHLSALAVKQRAQRTSLLAIGAVFTAFAAVSYWLLVQASLAAVPVGIY